MNSPPVPVLDISANAPVISQAARQQDRLHVREVLQNTELVEQVGIDLLRCFSRDNRINDMCQIMFGMMHDPGERPGTRLRAAAVLCHMMKLSLDIAKYVEMQKMAEETLERASDKELIMAYEQALRRAHELRNAIPAGSENQ